MSSPSVARAVGLLLGASMGLLAPSAAGAEDGVRGEVGGARVDLRGFLQADWVIARQSSEDQVVQSTGQPLNEDRFLLRRGRLRVDVDRGHVLGVFEIDANTVREPVVRPVEAHVSYRWPADAPGVPLSRTPSQGSRALFLTTSLGLLHTPFGIEAQEIAPRRPFLEPSTTSNALFPGSYDLGLRVMGGFRALEYTIAIMNGAPIGERQFPGRDPTKSKDLVVRIGADTRVAEPVRIAAGMSGVSGRGFHKGTPSTKDVLVWRDQNENSIVDLPEINVIAGTAATPSEGFRRFAMGADLRVMIDLPVLGELALRGEIVRATNLDRGLEIADPVALGRDLRELGWYVSATQELTRWGIVGVRYDRYDPDSDASEQRAFQLVPVDRAYTALSFMGAIRYERARLVLQYDRAGNALGRGANGAPQRLADDAITLRGEVGF